MPTMHPVSTYSPPDGPKIEWLNIDSRHVIKRDGEIIAEADTYWLARSEYERAKRSA